MIKPDQLVQEILANANADIIQSAFDAIIQHPHAEYLCLYGVGSVGMHLYETMSMHGINVDFFAESNEGGHIGRHFDGKPVLSFTELLKLKDRTQIIVSNGDTYQCWRLLKENGCPFVNFIGVWQIEHLDSIRSIEVDSLESRIEDLCELLGDELSKTSVLIWLNEMLRMNHDFERVRNICVSDQYFPKDIFAFRRGEHLVDAGAFIGDTVELLMSSVPNYEIIHAIEMSRDNYNTLTDNTRDFWNIKCHNVGLSNKCGEAEFIESKSGSRVLANEEIKGHSQCIKLVTLDSLLDSARVDYIKMDIEGAEFDALLGSERIIRRDKPKCAISSYHDPMHIFKIPFLLKQFVPEYKIYFRHHTQLLYELVCYATL